MNHNEISEYYWSRLREGAEVKNKSYDQNVHFFRHILLVATTILGIIVAFNKDNATNHSQFLKIFYCISIGILTVSILIIGIVVFQHVCFYSKVDKLYNKEISYAIKERRKVNPIYTPLNKPMLFFEKLGLVFLFTSVLMLGVYAVLLHLS